jgi:hypothetical protein
MSLPALGRRGVLGLLAALAARPALALPGAPGDPLARICARAARHPDLAALGHAHCARHPGTRRAAWLTDLARDLPPPATEAALVEHLRASAVADFRAGRIVDLAGWRVSLTEARICAAAVATENGVPCD